MSTVKAREAMGCGGKLKVRMGLTKVDDGVMALAKGRARQATLNV